VTDSGRLILSPPKAFEVFRRGFERIAYRPQVSFEGARTLRGGRLLVQASVRRWKAVVAPAFLAIFDKQLRAIAFAEAGLDEAAYQRSSPGLGRATTDALGAAALCKEQLESFVEGFHSAFPLFATPSQGATRWTVEAAVVAGADTGMANTHMRQYHCEVDLKDESIHIRRLDNIW
jgi:hypothetical protein